VRINYRTPTVASIGGRDGRVRSADGFIDLQVALPKVDVLRRSYFALPGARDFSVPCGHAKRRRSRDECASDQVTELVYTHVIGEDGDRVAAQLGHAVWGVLDAFGRQLDVNGRKKENGSGVESPKPLCLS